MEATKRGCFLQNVGLAVEYLSAKLDIRNDTVVSVVLQGSSAQLQPGAKLLVRHEPLTAKHGAVVYRKEFYYGSTKI